MEHQKILNLLNEGNDSKFVTRNWNIVNDQSNANYVGDAVVYTTEMLKSNFCDYNDAYILGRGDTIIIGHNTTQADFKNCAPFMKCVTKNEGTTINDLFLIYV